MTCDFSDFSQVVETMATVVPNHLVFFNMKGSLKLVECRFIDTTVEVHSSPTAMHTLNIFRCTFVGTMLTNKFIYANNSFLNMVDSNFRFESNLESGMFVMSSACQRTNYQLNMINTVIDSSLVETSHLLQLSSGEQSLWFENITFLCRVKGIVNANKYQPNLRCIRVCAAREFLKSTDTPFQAKIGMTSDLIVDMKVEHENCKICPMGSKCQAPKIFPLPSYWGYSVTGLQL